MRAQRSKIEEDVGAGQVRVLPFGVVMRQMKERSVSVGQGIEQSVSRQSAEADLPPVRLSPIELRNLALIDDPALEGMQRGDVSGCAAAGPSPEASPVCMEDDPSIMARVVGDEVAIGAEIRSIKCGQDGPLAHVRVSVHPDNPHFASDGFAVYSKDGKELICMVVPVESYEIASGCERIGSRAFDSAERLRRVTLPAGLQSIGRLAFAKSGLEHIDIPDSVRMIEEKAFYGCKGLKSCSLGQGVQGIEASAFALSGLERIRIPASVQELFADAFDKTPAEEEGMIRIDEGNERYVLDRAGGLYSDGQLAGILSCVADYAVAPDCTEILPGACCRNRHLRSVTLPEGLKRIGDDAFKGCRRLAHISLPESLERIGAHAFTETDISSLRLSAKVEHIGEGALLVGGENTARMRRPLDHLDLDARNERFYLEGGVLCERGAGDAGADKALLYVGPDTRVHIPDAVNRIAPYAFMGAVDIEELWMHGHMQSICQGALSVARSIPKVIVDVPLKWVPGHEDAPLGQKRRVTLPVPSLSTRFRAFTELFTAEQGCTVFVFPYYDAWVTNTRDVSEFARGAVARLREPIWMDEDMRDLYLGILRRKQEAVCLCFASAGDMQALGDLAAWGVLDHDAIESALDQVTRKADAQAIGCLLELKRRLGLGSRLDLTL